MNKRNRIFAVIAMLSSVLLLGGCKKQEVEEVKKEVSPILVTMDEFSMYIGNGTVNDLLEAGFVVTADEVLEKMLKEDQYIDGRTYFYDYYVSKDEEIYAKFGFINSQEEEIPYTDAIVYSVAFSLEEGISDLEEGISDLEEGISDLEEGISDLSPIYHTEHMLIDGINLKGLSPEEVDAAFRDKFETSEEILASNGILSKKVYTNDVNKVMVQFNPATMTAESVIAEVDLQVFE